MAAEERTAIVRFLVILLNLATYWIWLQPTGLGLPALAAALSVVALSYGIYDLFFQPYRHFPIMAMSAWTTLTDGALIALWLHATGGFHSPYYLLWYLSLVAVTFRYDWRAPLVASVAYGAAYTLLVAAAGGLWAHAVDMAIRVSYILLCGGLGALLARETANVFEARSRLDARMRQAEAEEARIRLHESESSAKASEAVGRLAAVVESSIDGIVTKDLSGTITSWNHASEAMFGYRAEEAIGRPITMLYPKGEEQEEARILARISAGEAVRIREARRIRKDGSALWVSVSASPLRDANGKVVGCASIKRDITHAREAKEASLRLAAVVQSSIDGILTKDLSGTITSWNPACQEMFGYRAEEAIGRPITMLYPKGEEQEEARILANIREGRPVRIREAKRVRKDGSTLWVSVSASPLRDASNRIIGAAAIKRNITEARLAEKERIEAKARIAEFEHLKELDRFKTQFINTAAHELRTPLLPLRTQLDLMMTDEQNPPRPAQKEAMEVMQRNLDRLGALVEDLLTVARSQAGRLQLDAAPVDLALVVLEAQQTFQTVADARGVRLVVEPSGPLPVLADGKRVGQVVANLLSNAFKFTPAGGEVRVSLRPLRHGAILAVSDTGMGIDAKDQARLFRPFVQVHDAAQVTQPGSGLGLYICRQLVELHGGTIGCESPGRGKGSTFWFTLPGTPFLAPPDAAPEWSPLP